MENIEQLREENNRLRKAIEELSILNDIARFIGSSLSVDAVIENVVKGSVRAVHGQQGLITLVDEAAPTEMKTLIRAQTSAIQQQKFHLNQNILGWMLINKKPLLSNELSTDVRFSGVKIDPDVQSVLCVPLLVKSRLTGLLTVFNKKEGGGFSEDDKRLLSIIGTQSAQVLENARLYEQERSLLTFQEQMKVAAQIQSDLLPQKSPQIPGYEIAGMSIPAQSIGGDYYDFIPIDESRIALCLGDVTGKGLPAALLMANVQATLRGQTLVGASAKECLTRSNQLLINSKSEEKFVTLFYGVLDYQQHKLNYCNAGHDFPYLISTSGEVKRLKEGGIMLGVIEGYPFKEMTVPINVGDLMVVYSDGITEAMDPNLNFYEESRLFEVLKQQPGVPVKEVVEHIVSAVKTHAGSHPQSDDITVVALRRVG
jgi:sigma-B regulation protein RsbU (phosphoserine phosphatase)